MPSPLCTGEEMVFDFPKTKMLWNLFPAGVSCTVRQNGAGHKTDELSFWFARLKMPAVAGA